MAYVPQHTAQLRATGDINQYRFIAVSGENQGEQATDDAVDVVGVSTGDVKAFDSDLHAQSGDLIKLQPGRVVIITLGTTLGAGTRVNSDATGRAVSATNPNAVNGILLQAGTTGAFVEMVLIESFRALD